MMSATAEPTADLAQCQREIELVAESNARLHDALHRGVERLKRKAAELGGRRRAASSPSSSTAVAGSSRRAPPPRPPPTRSPRGA